MRVRVYVCAFSCRAPESVSVCVCELSKKKKKGTSQRETARQREFAGMLYIRSLPLQFKQSRLCWQPRLPPPNGLHHV